MDIATRSQQDKSTQQTRLRTVVWQNGKCGTESSREILQEALSDPHALVWLDISGDCYQERELLQNVFKLESITLQDIHEEIKRAKFIQLEHYFYIVLHGMSYDVQTEKAYMPKVDIVFGKNFILTAHHASLPWLDILFEQTQEKNADKHLMGQGMHVLLCSLLNALVDSYFPVLDDIDDVFDKLERMTVKSTSNDVQVRIFHTKRALSKMRRIISPQLEVTNALVIHGDKFIPAKAEPYFVDVHDHLLRAFEVLDSYRDLMSGMLEMYLTTVSNRLNVIMKQLTIIASIFMPITFITGVFGQNFGHAPQVENDSGYLFWLVLFFIGLITVMQIWYFKKRGWL